MRRLLLLTSAIVFVDTMFFAAVAPILPQLAAEFDLSKSAAGVLSGSYAAGTLVAAIPGGWLAARVGVRPTVIVGLALMAGAGLAFALLDDAGLLTVARFVQGAGGAASWAGALAWLIGAAPRERRGELIGSALAAAIVGALFGPVLGGVADSVGRGPVFGAVALAGLGLAAWAARTPAADPRMRPSLRLLGRALRQRPVATGMWLILLPGMVGGAISVLIPLRFDELGSGAAVIAGVFLVAALLEALVAPLAGRVSDRRGRLAPLLVGLVAGLVFLPLVTLPESAVGLGVVTIAAAPAIGILWTPAMAMLSDGAEAVGLDQALAAALVNLGWGIGQLTGSAGGARLGEGIGDGPTFLLLAGLCGGTLLVVGTVWRGRRAGDPVPPFRPSRLG